MLVNLYVQVQSCCRFCFGDRTGVGSIFDVHCRLDCICKFFIIGKLLFEFIDSCGERCDFRAQFVDNICRFHCAESTLFIIFAVQTQIYKCFQKTTRDRAA